MTRRFLRENGLSLAFLAVFLVTLAAQALAGWREQVAERAEHHAAGMSLARYLVSSSFGADVMENWQSEFLQFSLFILATVWLVQRGSNESKELDQAGLESDERQKLGRYTEPGSPAWAKAGGWRTRIYSNSLLLAMTLVFFGTWGVQSLTSWRAFNEHQREHGEPSVTWARYLSEPEFWSKTLQNWQSEFLAVGTMAIFTVYLRQRGSPESKPVGSPHDETAASG